MKPFVLLRLLVSAAIGIVLFACQPTSPTAVRIESIWPSSGTIGTGVTIRGSGFSPDNNDVAFTHHSINFQGSSTAYLNGVASPEGRTLRFKLPELLGACPFSQMKADQACPAIGIGLPVGTIAITVVNRKGSSNSVTFERVKSEIEVATEVIYSSPSYEVLSNILDEITRRTGGGTTAIGIRECGGGICIDVYIEKDVPELSQKIPAQIENFVVRVQR
ncbi:MAG: IPT/TIG domain-containing protein [Chloroflexi bacterium]|nr:IPT/TIG domain-containing protein [Chloroflexota bacterium]